MFKLLNSLQPSFVGPFDVVWRLFCLQCLCHNPALHGVSTERSLVITQTKAISVTCNEERCGGCRSEADK